jgi:hypothetical protein
VQYKVLVNLQLHKSAVGNRLDLKSRKVYPQVSRDEMRVQHDKFYHTLLTVFAYKAKVKEICVDCEHKHSTEIAKEIGEYIHELKICHDINGILI